MIGVLLVVIWIIVCWVAYVKGSMKKKKKVFRNFHEFDKWVFDCELDDGGGV